MAIFSTKVGDAYIEVHGDTSEFVRDMRRAASTAGKNAGFDFGKAMNESAERELKGFRLKIIEATRTGDWRRLHRELRTTGNLFGDVTRALEDMNRAGQISDEQFESVVESLEKYVVNYDQIADVEKHQAVERHYATLQRQTTRLKQDMETLAFWDRQRAEFAAGNLANSIALQEIHARALRDNETFNERAAAAADRERDRLLRLEEQAARRLDRERILTLQRAAAERDFQVLLRRTADESESVAAARVRAIRSIISSLNTAQLRDLGDLSGVSADLERIRQVRQVVNRETTSVFGRLRSSRSELLHAIGLISFAFEQMVSQATSAMFRLAGGALTTLGNLIQRLGLGREGGPLEGVVSGLQRLGETLASGASAWVAAALALAVFVQGFVFFYGLVGVAVAGLSMLVGILTALVGVIATGLVAALTLAGPLLLGFVAGVGGAVVAVVGMTDRMKEGLEPIRRWFQTVAAGVAQNTFKNLERQLNDLMPVLRELGGPMLLDIGNALSRVNDFFVRTFTGAEFRNTLQVLRDTVPGIVQQIGQMFVSLTAGLLGFFSAISPKVLEIVTSIANGVETWSGWVNSAEGQNSIAEWFDNVWENAEKVWTILGLVQEVLGKIFEQSDEAGKTFLDGIIAKLQEFSDWLDTPTGREQFNQWMEDAQELARDLVDLLGDIGDFIKELDSEEYRAGFRGIVEGLQVFFQTLTILNAFMAPAIKGWGLLFTGLASVVLAAMEFIVRAVAHTVEVIRTVITGFFDLLSQAFTRAGEALGPFSPFGRALVTAGEQFGRIRDDAAESLGGVEDSINDVADTLEEARGKVDVFRDQISNLGTINVQPKVDPQKTNNVIEDALANIDKLRTASAEPGVHPFITSPTLDGILQDLDEINRSRPEPQVRAQITSPTLDSILDDLNEVDTFDANPDIFIPSQEAQQQIGGVLGWLDDLDAYDAKPTVTIDKTKPSKVLGEVFEKMRVLDSTTSSPRVDPETLGAVIELARVASDLDKVGRRAPKPKVSVSDDASWRLRSIQGLLGGIKSKTVTVSAVYASKGGFLKDGTVYAMAGGLIRGPGSGTSDSIPAMLSNGEFVMRADAVRRWGTGLMSALNRLDPHALDAVPSANLRGGREGFGAVRATTPSRTINVQSGAISLRSNATSPRLLANMVLDDMVAQGIGG